MESLISEGLIPTSDIAARYGVHPVTVRRWAMSGATARDGRRVHLEHVRTPGRLRTSFAAVERFLSAIGEAPAVPIPEVRTPTKRAKASADAREELRKMGV